jgi:hypothetical protein
LIDCTFIFAADEKDLLVTGSVDYRIGEVIAAEPGAVKERVETVFK